MSREAPPPLVPVAEIEADAVVSAASLSISEMLSSSQCQPGTMGGTHFDDPYQVYTLNPTDYDVMYTV